MLPDAPHETVGSSGQGLLHGNPELLGGAWFVQSQYTLKKIIKTVILFFFCHQDVNSRF